MSRGRTGSTPPKAPGAQFACCPAAHSGTFLARFVASSVGSTQGPRGAVRMPSRGPSRHAPHTSRAPARSFT
eukprot:1837077-Pyramimonas_sp.AAC.1